MISDFTPTGITLDLIKRIAPYAICAALGAAGAWWVQGLRLTAAEQDFEHYKLAQREASIEAERVAQIQREKANEAYETERSKLVAQVASGDVWRRCVAAGKCGRLSDQPAVQTNGVPPACRSDETGAGPVPTPEGAAAPVTPPVVADCALAVLTINRLQADIENQPEYGK